MGAKLLTIAVGSLLVILFIDFFTLWYAKFLKKWMPHFKIRVLLGRLVWTILAVVFWLALYRNHLPESFSLTYFFFVLFICSVRGLIESFVRGRKEKSIYL